MTWPRCRPPPPPARPWQPAKHKPPTRGTGTHQAPLQESGCCSGRATKLQAQIKDATQQLAELQDKIAEGQREALEKPPGTSYFAVFRWGLCYSACQ